MAEVPSVMLECIPGDIGTTSLEKGDIVVLTLHKRNFDFCEQSAHDDWLAGVYEWMRKEFPNNQCVVVDGGHLSIIRPQ